MLVYLDQNHASRVAKYLMGQPSHEHFGELYLALRRRDPLVPPSPFHVLETRGGYLLPVLQGLFAEFSRGLWVRPWQEVVARQARRARRGGRPNRDDLLARGGSWERSASLSPLEDLPALHWRGEPLARARACRAELAERFGVDAMLAARLPFFDLLSRLVAFRSLDVDRLPQESDLLDLVMAATVAPYVDVLATDRYVREGLARVGFRGRAFSGRRHEVAALVALLQGAGGGTAPASAR